MRQQETARDEVAGIQAAPSQVVPDRTEPVPRRSRPRTPLYPRLLRLRHIHPNAWQRAALGEGAVAVAGVLVLADVATAWTLVVLPVAVAVVVKGHDLLAGALARPTSDQPPATHQPPTTHQTPATHQPPTTDQPPGPGDDAARPA